MPAAVTNADVLAEEWYCEDCHEVHIGVNPPAICDICGSTLFENGLDVAGEGRPLPVRTRAAILTA